MPLKVSLVRWPLPVVERYIGRSCKLRCQFGLTWTNSLLMLLSPIERFVFRLELKIGAGKPFLNVIGLISIWSFSWFHLKRNNFAWKSWKSSEMNTLFIYLFMCVFSLSTYRPHYRWSLFSLPRYSCGTVLRISPYLLRMRENKDQK